MQPGVVAQNLHAKLALANSCQTSSEGRLDQDVHCKQRHGEEAEHQVKKGHIVREIDAEFGPVAQIDTVVAAGERIPPVGQSPYALAKCERNHQEINSGRTDRQ